MKVSRFPHLKSYFFSLAGFALLQGSDVQAVDLSRRQLLIGAACSALPLPNFDIARAENATSSGASADALQLSKPRLEALLSEGDGLLDGFRDDETLFAGVTNISDADRKLAIAKEILRAETILTEACTLPRPWVADEMDFLRHSSQLYPVEKTVVSPAGALTKQVQYIYRSRRSRPLGREFMELAVKVLRTRMPKMADTLFYTLQRPAQTWLGQELPQEAWKLAYVDPDFAAHWNPRSAKWFDFEAFSNARAAGTLAELDASLEEETEGLFASPPQVVSRISRAVLTLQTECSRDLSDP